MNKVVDFHNLTPGVMNPNIRWMLVKYEDGTEEVVRQKDYFKDVPCPIPKDAMFEFLKEKNDG